MKENMNDMLKEVRFALIEADVHPQVVTDFINQIEVEAPPEGLWPLTSEMVVKIVKQLVSTRENKQVLNLKDNGYHQMMVGLRSW